MGNENNENMRAVIATNKIRNYLRKTFFEQLKNNDFDEVTLPTLEKTDAYILDSDIFATQNNFKTIAPTGEVLSIGDDVIKGLITLAVKEQSTSGKLCASYDAYSFLTPNGRKFNEYQIGCIHYGEIGQGDQAEMVINAIEFAKKIGIANPKVQLGHTDIPLGVLSAYSGKDERLIRVKKILSGKVEDGVEYQTEKTLRELALMEGDSTVIKEIAGKIDSKLSFDGLLDVFETMKYLDAYNGNTGITIQPSYAGDGDYDKGFVFVVTDENGRKVLYGGRCDWIKGDKDKSCLYIKILTDKVSITSLENEILLASESRRVNILTKTSQVALNVAYRMREDLKKEGITARMVYIPDEVQLNDVADKYKDKVIVFINEEGQINYN